MRRIIRDMSAKVLPGILSFKYMRMAILNGYLKGKGFFFVLFFYLNQISWKTQI